MNQVTLIGNLTKEPEMRQTTNGKNVCSFTIAVNRRYKDAQGKTIADFFTILAWDKLAELCGRYLAKGRKCGVIGQLQNRSYDAKDGTKRYVTEIIAEQVEFLSAKNENTEAAEQTGFTDITDDDLPF